MFRFIVQNDGYKNAQKDWLVELTQTNCYWYDLLANPPPEMDTRKEIVQYLTVLRKTVEETLEKRFIYFICTRKRVRFDTRKKPRFSLFKSVLRLYVLIGKEEKRMPIDLVFQDPVTKQAQRPTVQISEKFISFGVSGEAMKVMSIHDFLISENIDLGLPTIVQYVGYTKSPETRPTNGAHTGLSDIQAKVSNEDNDLFLVFNLFKVLSNSINTPHMLNFVVANSMTDEIALDLEGRIIEKCFISYFDSKNQTRARVNERGELKRSLESLISNNKINSVQFVYEVDPPSEYWKLGSSSIRPSLKHVFTVNLQEGKVFIEEGATLLSGLNSTLP